MEWVRFSPSVSEFFTHTQRSKSPRSVVKVCTTGLSSFVLLNSISVLLGDQIGQWGVISVVSKWWLASRNIAVDRNACWKACLKAVLLKVGSP